MTGEAGAIRRRTAGGSGLPVRGRTQPIRVFHLITDLSTGGSQLALARLLSRIDRARFQPAVASLKNADTAVAREIRAMEIPVLDLGLTGPSRLSALLRLYTRIEDERPAILHAWLFHAVFFGRLIGRMAGVPIVISARRNVDLGSPLRERLNRSTAGFDDRVIAVSEAARNVEISRAGVPSGKVVVIPNGVDVGVFGVASPLERRRVRRSLGLPLDACVVATVGRLHPSKRPGDFLRAAAAVTARHPDTRFLVVGDGQERGALERLSRELVLDGRVLFCGERPDVPSLLGAADLFVLCSQSEGMSNALLEAMAAGLAVVATSGGGTAEVVEHGSTGLLVAPGDVGAIAAAVGSLLDAPKAAAEMAARARRKIAESHSIEATARRTQDLYEELIEERLQS